jgi:homospermidine synthase
MLPFSHKILVIGYGAVSKCTLPLLFRHIDLPFSYVTIIDAIDMSKDPQLMEWNKKGVQYVNQQITPDNLHEVLSKYVEKGSIILDLAWNIDTLTMLQWCNEHSVLYMNTSVEVWDPYCTPHEKSIEEKTLYWRQMSIRKAIASWKENSTTAIVDHGANPGLISHFTKQGLVDIASTALKDDLISSDKIPAIETALSEQNFAHLAMDLGVKVIHCSEHDQQVVTRPKNLDEFVNTWSVEGLIEEGMAPAELGWGTHEGNLPDLAHVPKSGPKNQIFLAQMGINTWVRSWIPSQEILGLLIRHGEAFGLSENLTVRSKEDPETVIYRPTVHYAYMPCNETLISLHELRAKNYQRHTSSRILNEDIVKGDDILGALIMGHHYKSWWTGSILSIEESRELVPNQNATTVQVAIGVVAALMWMIENPKCGFCLPDDLPYEKVLAVAKPYLGQLVSQASDWTPTKNINHYFKERTPIASSKEDTEKMWCFENFCFTP